jgi:hypothetical protein
MYWGTPTFGVGVRIVPRVPSYCRSLPAHGTATFTTGVPCSQEIAPPWDPAVALCLGPYGGPRGGGRFLGSKVPLYW